MFLRLREDVTWDDVCAAAKSKPPFSQLAKQGGHMLQRRQHSLLFTAVPSRNSRGDKIITSDDEATDEEPPSGVSMSSSSQPPMMRTISEQLSAVQQTKPPCKYGKSCYQRNRRHLEMYSHDFDQPSVSSTSDGPAHDEVKSPSKSPSKSAQDRPKCMFGRKCYRKSPAHLAMYSHEFDDAEEEEREALEDTAAADDRALNDADPEDIDSTVMLDADDDAPSRKRLRDDSGARVDVDDNDDIGLGFSSEPMVTVPAAVLDQLVTQVSALQETLRKLIHTR